MPRQNRRRVDQARVASGSTSAERREQFRGEAYVVRTVTGSSAAKAYRCPGCDQLVGIGMPHVVAWPVDDDDATHRRHWHTGCWAGRESRMPGVQRSRSAPRY